MKKQVLFLTLSLLAAVSAIFAQTRPVKQVWHAQKDPAREEKALVQREHLALTPSGELYAAGRFSSTFSFAGADVEPIAGSCYLLKYDAKGKEKWAVAIQGAVSPTAITLAENGDVYLAASFNDKIRLNTTSGSPVELSGRAANDELPNAFIACYSPDGALKHHSLFKPDSVTKDVLDVRFVIRKILVQAEKVYIAAESHGANVKNGAVTFSGTYMDVFGIMFSSLNKVFVAELDATATATRILLDAGPEAGGTLLCNAVTPSLALDKEGNLFVGFVANGNQKIKIGGRTESRQYFSEAGTYDFTYVLANIKLSDLSFRLNENKVRHNKDYNLCRISNLEVAGDKLLVFGTFNDSLPYNHKIKAVSADDAFIAGLKKTDFSLLFSAASGISEGDDPRYFEEQVFGSGVLAPYASMVVNTVDTRPTGKYLKSYEIVYDLTKNSLSVSPTLRYMETGFTAANNRIAGAALDGLGTASTKLNFLVAASTSNSVKTPETLSMEVYPRATADVVNFSETCDVEVNNIGGQCLKKFKAVSAVDLSDLPKGIYILLLSTKEGPASVKVIRK